MEENSNKAAPEKKGFRTEFIVAMTAILISLATLTVYVYQARIMQNQQHTSVWPYIEWTLTTSSVEGIFLSVKNKGVGPAIVRSTDLRLDSIPMNSVREMLNLITHGKTDSLWAFTTSVNKRVLAPGEEIRLFHIQGDRLLKMDLGNIYQRIQYKICYCSIYGDCWTSRGLEVVESKCE